MREGSSRNGTTFSFFFLSLHFIFLEGWIEKDDERARATVDAVPEPRASTARSPFPPSSSPQTWIWFGLRASSSAFAPVWLRRSDTASTGTAPTPSKYLVFFIFRYVLRTYCRKGAGVMVGRVDGLAHTLNGNVSSLVIDFIHCDSCMSYICSPFARFVFLGMEATPLL